MNPAQLLAHFDRISDAPEAIPRLRRFILDLAVRGKLVEQDPSDEPASELLKKIHGDGAQLIKNRGLHAEPDEIWPIPAHWVFVPLELIAMPNGLFTDGDWVESKDQDPNGDVRLTQLADVGMGEYRNRSSRFMNSATAARLNCTFLKTGDILIARMPDPLGRACIFPGDPKPCVTVVDVAVLRLGNQEFNGAYVVHAINSSQFAKNVQSKAAGTTRSRISRGNLSALPFPLPPIAEQQRIVAKVDELMALCDRLEAAQAERESRRDRLVASSLNRLNNGADPDAFRDHARFYFNHLPRLTTKPEHIQQLRQTILNLAVRGKLVPQDSNDEPASELLERVAAQKAKVGNAKTGRDWVGDIAKPVDEAFVMPKGWAWTRIANTVERVTVGYVGPMKDQYVEDGIPFLRSQNVRANRFREDGLISISPKFHQTISKSALAPGDVVVVRSGNVGTACVIPPSLLKANCSDLVVVKHPIAVHPAYLCFYLNSLASTHIEAGTVGVALTHFNTKSVATMPFPLPPLAEQHRIVTKVDELMALCDKLDAQLTTTHTDSRRLLEAVLHEALAPAV